MRWLVGIVVALVFVGKPAHACGFWTLVDSEKKLEVGWLFNAGTVTKADNRDKRLANMYLDVEAKTGVRVAADHKVVFDVRNGKILRYGESIGTVDGDTVTIGKHVYTIEFTDPSFDKGLDDIHILAWKLAVHRGDDVIITAAKASSLCAALRKGGMTDAEQQDEVRRRVVFYLAWRERGM